VGARGTLRERWLGYPDTWGRASGQSSAWWLVQCREWGSKGAPRNGGPFQTDIHGAPESGGPSRAPGVSRPGGAAAGLFLLGGICRMCS
jgi:hypothetical protein